MNQDSPQFPLSHVKVLDQHHGKRTGEKKNAFGRTDAQEERADKQSRYEAEDLKSARTAQYGGHPDGYYEVRSDKPTMWRA